MRTIRVRAFGGPEVLQVEDAPTPVPGPGEVVVRVHAAGVNPVDTYVRAGSYARLPALPFTPGTDAAGEIESVGSDVGDLKPGARVYVAGLAMRHTGTYAQFVLAERRAVRPLPDAVSYAQGAALGVPYVTAARAVFDRAQLRPGETVFVHGASGGVGLAALQFARMIGAHAFGSAGSPQGRDLVSAQGATALDHTTSGYAGRLLELTEGRGVDAVIEMLANVNLVRDFEFLAMRGRIVVVGSRGALEFDPRLTMAKEASVLGTMLWHLTPQEREHLFDRVDAGLASGALRPVVGREMRLDDAPEAHRALIGSRAAGKLVLAPWR